MTERDEITLHVDLPDVVETPYRIEVRCGKTAVSVHEHGVHGSGAWAIWTGGGSYTVGDEGGKYHPTVEEALAVAREHVRREERSRRLHEQLAVKLAKAPAPQAGGSDAR